MGSKWTPASVAVFAFLLLGLGASFFGLRLLLRNLAPFLGGMDGLMAKQVREARAALANAKSDTEKCDPLSTLAKDDFNHGKIPEARKYATELLAISARMQATYAGRKPMEYGIATHDGNMVLGRIALHEHKTEAAKQYLLKAGLTTGAATLDSFGPNMSLANDLLGVGERGAVIQYFHECHRFWSFQSDTLNSWEDDVKAGNTPNFGANLYY